MQIGNRLFPYPVVNRNKALSDFKDNACYKLAFGDPDYPIKDDRHDLVLQDIYIELVDDTLTTYVEKDLLQPMLVVESPESVFRQTYKLSLVPQTIYIPLNSLSGKVTVSSYLYATQNIADYRSLNFIEDFEGIDFDLNQYDIVGVDDGFSINIEHNDLADNVAESIFEVIRGKATQKYLQYEASKGESKIYIYLPSDRFEEYSNVKHSRYFMNIFMGLIVIPVLVDIFNNIKEEFRGYTDITDVIESYPWFKSVVRAYNAVERNKLTMEIFTGCGALEFAQTVFNNMNINAIQEATNMILKGGEIDGED